MLMTFDLCVGFCLVILDVMPDVLGQKLWLQLCVASCWQFCIFQVTLHQC